MAGIQNKLLTETIIVIHSEKEAFVVKNTGNRKENIEKSSEVAPLDGTNIVIHWTLNLSKICLDVPNLPQIWLFLVVFFRNFHHILKLEQFFEFS